MGIIPGGCTPIRGGPLDITGTPLGAATMDGTAGGAGGGAMGLGGAGGRGGGGNLGTGFEVGM